MFWAWGCSLRFFSFDAQVVFTCVEAKQVLQSSDFLLLLLSISESSKDDQTRGIKHPKTTSMKGLWAMGKPMMRSDLASEAV